MFGCNFRILSRASTPVNRYKKNIWSGRFILRYERKCWIAYLVITDSINQISYAPYLKKIQSRKSSKNCFLIALICIIIVLGFISITTGPLDIKAIDAFRVIINKVAPGMRPELPEHITRTV